MTDRLRVELLINALAAIVCFSFVIHVMRNRTRSLLESRATLLLIELGVLCTLRGLHWWMPDAPSLAAATFCVAAFLPLALILFAEGLLRRHSPLGVKLTGTAAAIGFPVAFALDIPHSPLQAVLAATILLVLGALATLLTVRQRELLSTAENELIRTMLLVAAAAVPLGITDVSIIIPSPAVRMGSLAVIVLVYVLTRVTESRDSADRLAIDLYWRVLQAVLLAFAFVMLTSQLTGAIWLRALVASLAIVLFFEVWERLGSRMVIGDDHALLRWLARAQFSSLEQFLRALQQYPRTAEHLLVGDANLAGYDPDRLRAAFPATVPVISAAALRQTAGWRLSARVDAAEQLLDLLGKYEMTHACLLASDPLRILLFNFPEMPGNYDEVLELRIIQRFGSFVIAREAEHA